MTPTDERRALEDGMPEVIYTVTKPGAKAGLWCAALLYKNGHSSEYVLKSSVTAKLEAAEQAIALLKSANKTYIGGQYVAVLHPDHVDQILTLWNRVNSKGVPQCPIKTSA